MIRAIQNVQRTHPRCRSDEFGHITGRSVCEFEFFWSDGCRAPLSIAESLFGTANVVGLAHGPGVALRSRRLVQRDPSDWCLLTLAVDGSPAVTQGGNNSVMVPGSVTILDCGQPMAVRFDHETRCIIFRLPRSVVLESIPEYRSLCGLAYDCRMPAQRLWQSVTERQLPIQETLTHILSRCRAAWSGAPEGGADAWTPGLSEAEMALYWRVLAYIEQQLDSPELTPTRIAQAHTISPRYLHRVFAKTGETVAEHIRGTRLEKCRDEIRDSAAASITEVAFRWGFVDVAHFSRAFKGRFGCSPRQYRRQV